MSYVLLSHTKVSGTSTQLIDISSIDQTYQDLCFWWCGHENGTGTYANAELYIYLNGDRSSHYSSIKRYAAYTTNYANRTDLGAEFIMSGLGNKQYSNNQGATLFGYMPAYRDTTSSQGKSLFMRAGSIPNSSVGSSGAYVWMYGGQYTEEVAINRIEIGYVGSSYLAPDSTFTLYGVKNS